MERKLIYETRDMLLDGGTVAWNKLIDIAMENTESFLKQHHNLTLPEFNRYILDNISYKMERNMSSINLANKSRVKAYIKSRVEQSLNEKLEQIGSEKGMNDFIRVAALSAIDEAWIEQVDYLQKLSPAKSDF